MGDPSLVKDYVETIDKLILSGGQMSILVSMAKKENHQAMITISRQDQFGETPYWRKQYVKQTGSRNLPWGSNWSMAFGGTLNQEIEGHWQETSVWDSHSIRTKKAVWVKQLLDRPVGLIPCTVKASKDLAPEFPCDCLWSRSHHEAIEAIDGHRIIDYSGTQNTWLMKKGNLRTLPLFV